MRHFTRYKVFSSYFSYSSMRLSVVQPTLEVASPTTRTELSARFSSSLLASNT
jgi:hypothetical protein